MGTQLPPPKKRVQPPIFVPCPLSPNKMPLGIWRYASAQATLCIVLYIKDGDWRPTTLLTVVNSSLASSLRRSYNPHLAVISFYLSGSYNYNSIKICKQISTPPQPHQKIPDIYFLCSCSLPNFITIPSPISIQFAVDVFVLYVILYLLLYCLLCYLVL